MALLYFDPTPTCITHHSMSLSVGASASMSTAARHADPIFIEMA
jgi:hypothetical protein